MTMKILIMEDSLVNTRVLTNFLSKYGDCDTARNGDEGVEKYVKGLDAGAPFNLVTIDLEMPGMSGVEAMNKIRDVENERNADKSLIFTVSAHADQDHVIKSAAYCQEFVRKPVEYAVLGKKLRKHGVKKKNDDE